MEIARALGNLHITLGAVLLLLSAGSLKAESDVVNEKLSAQPLNNGDMLFVLDLDIHTSNYSHFVEHMTFPGVLMDTLPPDFAKLFLRSQALNFVATQHAGEWREAWGDNLFPVFKAGETLQASWSDVYSDMEVYDFFETLAHGLWGLTGSQFHALTSNSAVIFDMTHIASLEEPLSSKRKAKSLMASYSEDVFCVDNLYKWRTMLPSLGNYGLTSIVNDERIWSKAPYKGVRSTMHYKKGILSLIVQFQVVVKSNYLENGIWNVFPEKEVPSRMPGVSNSFVEFLVPQTFRIAFNGEDRIQFNFNNEENLEKIGETFQQLSTMAANGIGGPRLPKLKFNVSELESVTFNVLKRAQSSLSVVIVNTHPVDKYVKFVQPLPQWALPQLSSLSIEISENGECATEKILYSCKASECMGRTVYRESHMGCYSLMETKTLTFKGESETINTNMESIKDHSRFADVPSYTLDAELDEDLSIPYVVFEKSDAWIQIGFSVRLPPNSTLKYRFDIQKNKFSSRDIDYMMHRGQLIHSGVLVESDTPSFEDFSELSDVTHLTGEFFSYVLLPDITMSFNVVAAIGVVSGLLFGLVFNLGTRNLFRQRDDSTKHAKSE